jgi:hypothetical protein
MARGSLHLEGKATVKPGGFGGRRDAGKTMIVSGLGQPSARLQGIDFSKRAGYAGRGDSPAPQGVQIYLTGVGLPRLQCFGFPRP